MGSGKLSRLRTYIFIIAGVTTLTIGTFLGWPAIARQMNDWRLLPRPERLTELYFTDYQHLPTAEQSDVTQTVTFTVHNLEHQTTTYYYTLTAQAEGQKTEYPVGTGDFVLDQDKTAVTSKVVMLPQLTGRVALKVSLEYKSIAFGDDVLTTQKQSIHYWTATDKPEKEADSHEGA